MKKNTVKKLNTVFVSGVAILLILTVFFCSFSPAMDVFASEFFPQDCPDCEDGTCTVQTVVDCTASGCVDGSVTTNISSTCSTCSGESELYSSSTSTCTECGGDGMVSELFKKYANYRGTADEDEYLYIVRPCTACGGTLLPSYYS